MRARFAARAPQERKVIDIASASYGLDSTGSVTALNLVATGTDYTNRIGRRIQMKTVQMRALATLVDETAGPLLSRVLLVWDLQPNGALAAITDVLLTATPDSFMNLNNRDRFRVLWDNQFAFGRTDNTATQAVAVGPAVKSLNVFKSCNQVVTFGGTTAAIASMETGVLLLITIASQAAAAAATLIATFRMRFVDA